MGQLAHGAQPVARRGQLLVRGRHQRRLGLRISLDGGGDGARGDRGRRQVQRRGDPDAEQGLDTVVPGLMSPSGLPSSQ